MGGGREVPPGERGATRVADRVVAKIASRAAREALAGELREHHAAPTASVVVRDESARVRVHMELGYPVDLRARCRAVRRQVAERLETLAGMSVPEVVITVERLHSPHLDRAGAGRVR
ncbi:Asp23/Gls24 family envelope stress response protein [Streptomyces orinoci]|uniref:Asp23/Gls24 family envelope stress response protein n=1 Tax=Streptomyces orinoci TaxID=67339 RepID=A0ABV3JWV9_STRON|nr:Asp23/Gls24 family envelope stress response protein [Streptomyces orinoci]